MTLAQKVLSDILNRQKRKQEQTLKEMERYNNLPRHEIKLPGAVVEYYRGDRFNGD
jgi:hypothetical protein